MRKDNDWMRSLSWSTIEFGTAMLMGIGAGTAAHADQTRIYEWRDANGIATYSQVPPGQGTPGVASRVFDTRSFTHAQRLAVRSQLHALDQAQLADAKRFRQQVELADEKVNDALRQLAKSETTLRQGRAPLTGERMGNVGGGSRLRAEYFERQRQLETAVQAARSGLQKAYTLRDGIRP